VVREGFSADRVFVVCRGTVKITAASADGDLLILRVAGPGSVLGLASVLRGPVYKVSAETLEACELKSIPRAKFLEMMKRFPDVSHNTAVAVSQEYEAALLSARRLALSTSAAGKLASVLLEWGRMKQGDAQATFAFQMPLTHEELGCMAGLSRETVTRLLGRFRSEGLLEQRGDVVVIQKPETVERLYS
jgi:CRP/FNR family cyclic AMP-dependent transcriptional regulator